MDLDNVEIIPDQAIEAIRAAKEEKLAALEARRISRTIPVPVDDVEVRLALRQRRLPVCLFGEDAHDRRERLRTVLTQEHIQSGGAIATTTNISPTATESHAELNDEPEQEEYYTEGTPELRALRLSLALPSLQRMRARLARERLLLPTETNDHEQRRHAVATEAQVVMAVRSSVTVSSQIGDVRPLSSIACGFTNGARSIVATGAWSGTIAIWCGTNFSRLQEVSLHEERVSALSMPREHPGWLLSCGADSIAGMHAAKEDGCFETKHIIREHKGRVSDAKMHPFHEGLVATASFDGSLMLHDGGKLLLQQETGHSEVYRVGFHPDGSLLGSCGLEGGLRIWDLRSGRAVMTMAKAHSADVLALEFNSDGRVLASGGKDNVVRIWDLRTVRCARTIAAHRNLVSGMRFGGGVDHGDVLFTGSFDRTVKCWAARRNWGLVAAHTSYEDKVTGVDCSADGTHVVSACYDKTWKVWASESTAE